MAELGKIRNIIFDVDGTLWDSAESVAESWNQVLTRYPETRDIRVTREDEYRFMGHTMYEIAARMLPGVAEPRRSEIMDRCMEEEIGYLLDHPGSFYPELAETLGVLEEDGYSLFIVSNCQDGYIEAMMTSGAFTSEIRDFECFGRTGLKKAGSIRLLMERNGLEQEACVYVGDTAMDEAASREAGIRFVHAAYGFGEAQSPDGVIEDIRDLPGVLAALG